MALLLIRDLPGAPGFLATIPCATRERRRNVGISVGMPGPHDFVVRVDAARRPASPRPPHPRLACRDDRAQRPSVVRQDVREHRGDLPDMARGNNAAEWHDGQFAHGPVRCELTMTNAVGWAKRSVPTIYSPNDPAISSYEWGLWIPGSLALRAPRNDGEIESPTPPPSAVAPAVGWRGRPRARRVARWLP